MSTVVMTVEERNKHDWRKSPSKGWPYKSIDDLKYIKERSEFFLENGGEGCEFNGWWWYQGSSRWSDIRKKRKIKEDINAK